MLVSFGKNAKFIKLKFLIVVTFEKYDKKKKE